MIIKQDEVNTTQLFFFFNYEEAKVFEIKCQCGHVNLIPVTEVFHVDKPIECEKCGKIIAEPKETN